MGARRRSGEALRRASLFAAASCLCFAVVSPVSAAHSRAVPLPKPKPSVARNAVDAPIPRAKPEIPMVEQDRRTGDRSIRMSAIPPYVEPEKSPTVPSPKLSSDACLEALRSEGVEAVRAEAPKDKAWCAIEDPVSIVSMTGPGGTVDFPARPLLDCKFATAFARWVNGVVAPVGATTMDSEIRSVDTGPGYVCRNMNGAAQAKRSAHAIGNAIDVVGFRFRNGKNVLIESFDAAKGDERLFLSALRTSACGYFLTVLGPGSDAAHGNHLHVDIAQPGRSANYRICQ